MTKFLQKGQYLYVTNATTDLRTALGSYYNAFSIPSPTGTPVISVPYPDWSGLGNMNMKF